MLNAVHHGPDAGPWKRIPRVFHSGMCNCEIDEMPFFPIRVYAIVEIRRLKRHSSVQESASNTQICKRAHPESVDEACSKSKLKRAHRPTTFPDARPCSEQRRACVRAYRLDREQIDQWMAHEKTRESAH